MGQSPFFKPTQPSLRQLVHVVVILWFIGLSTTHTAHAARSGGALWTLWLGGSMTNLTELGEEARTKPINLQGMGAEGGLRYRMGSSKFTTFAGVAGGIASLSTERTTADGKLTIVSQLPRVFPEFGIDWAPSIYRFRLVGRYGFGVSAKVQYKATSLGVSETNSVEIESLRETGARLEIGIITGSVEFSAGGGWTSLDMGNLNDPILGPLKLTGFDGVVQMGFKF